MTFKNGARASRAGIRVCSWASAAVMALSAGGSLTLADTGAVITAGPHLPDYQFSSAHTQMFYDNDAFNDMTKLVEKAQHSIRVDFYIFGGPDADHVADVLIEKYRMGLNVRVMLDRALGSVPMNWKETKPILKKLQAAGVPTVFYSKQVFLPDDHSKIIDHNKYIAVDAEYPELREATVGSTNFSTLFKSYHDLLVHFDGPVVKDLADQFDFDFSRAWAESKGSPVRATTQAPSYGTRAFSGVIPGPNEPSQLRLLGTGFGRSNIFNAIMRNIRNSKRTVDVMVHEFDEPRLLDAMIDAKNRGVKVRVMMDPWASIDKFMMGIKVPKSIPNIGMIEGLTAAGIETRLYRISDDKVTAHMKMVVVDGEIMNVGSANWTDGAWERVSETNVEVMGGQAVQEAQAQFESDWSTRGDSVPRPTQAQIMLYKIYKWGSDKI